MTVSPRIRSWLKIVSINFAVLLIGLVALELYFGAWVRAPGLWTLSIQRDFAYRSWEVEKYLRDQPMRYSRDYYGFRGNTHPIDTLNMLALGGSTTDEPNVSDEETWTARLEACLNGQGIAAKIGNAGINGQSSLGHIRNFSAWFNQVPDLHPKFISVYAGINEPKITVTPNDNDFNDDVTFRDKAGEPNRRWGDGTARRYTLGKVVGDWIAINSAVYSLYRIVAGNIVAMRTGSNPRWRTELYYDSGQRGVLWDQERASFSQVEEALSTKSLGERALVSLDRLNETGKRGAMQVDESFTGAPTLSISGETIAKMRSEEDAAKAPLLRAYRERLITLVGNIRDFGAQPILITQPKGSFRRSGQEVSGNILSFVQIDAFNRVMMATCRELGAICVDLAANIEIADGDYWDWEHTTPDGSAKVGAQLCRMLTASRSLTTATFSRP